jgi:aldehyde dehydrogenase (NAD+)
MTLQSVLEDIQKRPGAGELIPIIDSVSEEQIGELTDCGPEFIDEAVARAKSSFESGVWSGLPGRERAKILWRIADLIDEHAAEFAAIDSANTGMMKMQSELVVPTCAEFFRYYAGWCSKINGTAYDIRTSGIASDAYVDQHGYTLREPYGVVGLIFPWNGPIFNACAKIAPALAAGCSSLVKPAEETPLSALLLDWLIHEAGVPEGVVNLITGYGHTADAAITAHPDVEKVAFTGSTEVGKEIVKASPSPWRTTPATASPPRPGPPMSAAHTASSSGCRPVAFRSTVSWSLTTTCRSAGTSSPAGGRSSAAKGSRPT